MTSQRSFSGRCFHGGMAPRPLEIFQNSSPSVSLWTLAEVQSAGLGGGSAAAATPSPLPEAPWHVTQLVSTICFAFPMPFTGFFMALASAGAVHSPCADTTAIPAPATNTTAARAVLTNLASLLIGLPPWTIVMKVRTRRPLIVTSATETVKELFTPERRLHVGQPRELHPRPAGPAPAFNLERVQTLPVLVRYAPRLARAHQSIDRSRLGLDRFEHASGRGVLQHARHRLRRIRLVRSYNAGGPAFDPARRVFADARLPGVRIEHAPLLVEDDAPGVVERHAGQRDAAIPDRSEHEPDRQRLDLTRGLGLQ